MTTWWPTSPTTCRRGSRSWSRRGWTAGACIVNDVTALTGDPEMPAVARVTGAGVILMHMQGTPRTMQDQPRYDDVVDDIRAFFEERLHFAAAAGIREEQIWLDPGFGFGKTVDQNLLAILETTRLSTAKRHEEALRLIRCQIFGFDSEGNRIP